MVLEAAPSALLSATNPLTFQSTAFGFTWFSDQPLLPFVPSTAQSTRPSITVRTLATPLPERDFTVQRNNVQFARDGFRYNALPQAMLDSFGHEHVHIHPGTDGETTPPAALFSTVTAILLAARGLLPLHGSAVVQDGVATMVCGRAGMGKSTTVARLIAQGAQLLSDDLSVLQSDPAGGPPLLFAGRRSIRLHVDTAAMLSRAVCCSLPSHEAEGKIAVYPPQADPHRAWPLARVILLGQPAVISAAQAPELIAEHLFRPGCLAILANHYRRLALLAIATRFIQVTGAPPYDCHATVPA